MNLDYLAGIQFKEPSSATVGYLQLIYNGVQSSQGLTNAIKDADSITFNRDELELAIELKEYLLDYIFKS